MLTFRHTNTQVSMKKRAVETGKDTPNGNAMLRYLAEDS